MDYCVIHIDFYLWQVVGTVYDRRINILHVQKKISEKKKKKKTENLCQYRFLKILFWPYFIRSNCSSLY